MSFVILDYKTLLAMPPKSARSHYLLLLRQPNDGVPPPEEMQKIVTRFQAWMEGLEKKKMLESTNRLELRGKVLRGRRGRTITDGPYTEAKEVVGGYVLISAQSLEEAVAAARECPGLDYNLTVEIRPVQE